jgi:periplasmic copper chaperone A
MKRTFFFAAILALFASAAGGHEYKLGTLEIAHPWTRATPKGASVAGGYLKVTNKGTAPDRLKSAVFELSPRVEIHEMAMSGTTMQMRELKSGLEIKPGETVELKPGSFHIMFMNLKKPLEQGQRIKGSLIFEKAGSVEVEFVVEAMGTPSPGQGKHNH